jgi:hypothetical protein
MNDGGEISRNREAKDLMGESGSDYGLIKKYLLGELTEHEQEEVEKRLLVDRDFSEEVSMGRTDLVDEYVAAVLTLDERRRFEEHFLSTPKHFQMVEIARALDNRFDGEIKQSEITPLLSRPFYRRHLTLIVTVIAGASLVAFVIWQVIMQRPRDRTTEGLEAQRAILQNELSSINRGPMDSRQNAFAVVPLTLRPILARDLAENRSVVIPANPSIIGLRLELLDNKYPDYKATLKTNEGYELAAVDRLTSESSNKGKVVVLNLPSWLMRPGSYQVELSGRLPSNEYEQISLYPFDILDR